MRFASGILIGIVIGSAAHSASFDMRNCPLDQISFIDPWAQGRFDVERSGERHYFMCGPDLVKVDAVTEDFATCTGPYGLTFMEGRLRDGEQVSRIRATYHMDHGTAPCCGWDLERVTDSSSLPEGAVWHGPGSSPPLGDFPFAEIDDLTGEFRGQNPLSPLVCRGMP